MRNNNTGSSRGGQGFGSSGSMSAQQGYNSYRGNSRGGGYNNRGGMNGMTTYNRGGYQQPMSGAYQNPAMGGFQGMSTMQPYGGFQSRGGMMNNMRGNSMGMRGGGRGGMGANGMMSMPMGGMMGTMGGMGMGMPQMGTGMAMQGMEIPRKTGFSQSCRYSARSNLLYFAHPNSIRTALHGALSALVASKWRTSALPQVPLCPLYRCSNAFIYVLD